MKDKLIEVWKDPVWSKVIAALLLAIIALGYNYAKALYNDTTFMSEFAEFWQTKISLWIVIMVILLTYIISNLKNRLKTKVKFIYDTETIELDRTLFNRIRNELIPKETLDDLYNHTFSNHSFERAKFNFISKILSANENPEFEFLNPELESAKIELVRAIREFQNSTFGTIYSAPSHNDIGFLGIPREWDQQKFYAAMDKIQPEEINVFKKAEYLIKLGRRILKI